MFIINSVTGLVMCVSACLWLRAGVLGGGRGLVCVNRPPKSPTRFL